MKQRIGEPVRGEEEPGGEALVGLVQHLERYGMSGIRNPDSGCVQELEESEKGPTINTSKDEQGDFDNDDVDIITIDDHNLMSL